jgi:hypothetical protein
MANRRLQPADGLLAAAVAETIRALDLVPADAAGVALALRYADTIDQADNRADAVERLGPKLLAVLDALGATPTARARIKTGGAPSAGNDLDRLRAARRVH